MLLVEVLLVVSCVNLRVCLLFVSVRVVFAFCTTVVTVLVDIITNCIGCRFWKDCCIHGSNFESDLRQGKGDNVSEFGKMQFLMFLKRIKAVVFA